MVSRGTVLVLLAVAVAASACGAVQRPRGAEPLAVRDLDGREHTVPAADAKATTLLFVTHDCPIANSYAPEVNRIVAAYEPRGVAFYLVYADPGLEPAAAKRHAAEYGYRCPAFTDPGHRLVKRAGATITPEAVVLSPDGKLLYRGRIDDRYVDFGRKRPEPTVRDLRRSLDAILAGKPVPQRTTKAVGCFIPVAADAGTDRR